MSIIEVDPNQFIITKKRKRYKFALFHNSPICFELEEWQSIDADILELGAGTGVFSVELATRYPDKKFIAVDVKADRLQKGAREATSRGLENIFFVRARADQLDQVVDQGSLTEIWLTFPDPFPKKRSAARRMSHPKFLTLYARLLRSDGSFMLKHDSRDFFLWSLESIVNENWHITELTFDLHESDLNDDYKVLTTYEHRWLGEGTPTNFVRATPRSSDDKIEL